MSRTTLNTALEDLERQGIIYRRQGAGIFAASRKQRQTVALVCNATFFQGRTHSPFWDVLLEQARDRAAADALDREVRFCKWDDPDSSSIRDAAALLPLRVGPGRARGRDEPRHQPLATRKEHTLCQLWRPRAMVCRN